MSEPTSGRDFNGRSVIITGGAVGFGKALAIHLANRGADVVICGRSQESLDAAVAEADQSGAAILAVQADVTSTDDMSRLFRTVDRKFHRLDGLVCAAGSASLGTILDISLNDWMESTDKLRGIYLPVRHAAEMMKAQGSGSIVAAASVHAHANVEERDAIATVTAGTVAFMRGVAISLGKYGIRANSVSPGPLETPTWRTNWQKRYPDMPFEEIAARVGGSIPLQRIGAPDDIAEPIAFLLSDAARYITGIDLPIDGGLCAKLAMRTALD